MPTFRDKRPPPQDLITIYLAANHSTKEAYIAPTDLLIHELIEHHRQSPPEPISHWKPDHRIDYSCLAYSIPLAESEPFIEKSIREEESKGWRVLRRKPHP